MEPEDKTPDGGRNLWKWILLAVGLGGLGIWMNSVTVDLEELRLAPCAVRCMHELENDETGTGTYRAANCARICVQRMERIGELTEELLDGYR